jgi:TonB-linked SusC/RagA family outer membrane protein
LGLVFLFCLIPLWALAQQVAVRGSVVDAQGEPIIGASVLQKGTTNGTITNVDGEFSLSAPAGSTLTVSYIGYIDQEVAARAGQPLRVVLREDTELLEEVVVIGYGTQRREAVTGSVASMRGDNLRQVQTGNVTNALQGRIAGVEMSQTSTRPGESMQIRIRGVRSLTASNDPLVVLDGVPFAGSINDIDPNSIKGIDILKDASATAIYGSRGANGVILVSTNKGTRGAPAQVSYNGYYGMKNAVKFPMMNGPEFAQLHADAKATTDEAGAAERWPLNATDEDPNMNVDWQDNLYRTAITTSHDINVLKGTESGSYSFGLGYYVDQTPIPENQYSRISLRASVDESIGKYLKVGISTNNSYALTEGNNMDTGGILSASPLAVLYNADGTLKRAVMSSSTDSYYIWNRERREATAETWISESKNFASYNNAYAEIEAPWVPGLKYRATLGLNYRISAGGGFTGIGVGSVADPNAPSGANESHSLMTNWVIENLLTYDNTFGKHHVNFTGLFSAEQTHYNSSGLGVNTLPADYFQYYDLSKQQNPDAINIYGGDYSLRGLVSYMGRLMYDYDGKYMLSAALRSDGSSVLAKGHKWHVYPAVSLGWNVKREAFMDDVEWLDNLKLRVGYGETSNQAIDPYKTLGLLGTRQYNFGTTYLTGYKLSELPNSALGWEYTKTWNFGVDFTILKNRLSGTIEYYSQLTEGLLQSVRLPSTAGVGSYMANIGSTSNKGFELTLNGTILDNVNGWTWEAGINVYLNKNKIVSLNTVEANPDGEPRRDEGNSWFEGYPINVIYDYEYDGLWNKGDKDFEHLQALEPGGNEGMIKVKYNLAADERAADGTPLRPIGPADRQIIELDPNFQGGFNTRVAYKGFDLTLVGSFQNGGKLISAIHGAGGYLNFLNGRHNNVRVDYWTPNNTDAKYPRPSGIQSNDNPKYIGTLGLFDGTFLKVRTITLGYDFKHEMIKVIGAQRLRLYATLQNPFVLFSPFHNETGMDPEPNSRGNQNQASPAYNQRLLVIGYNAPTTRNVLFGINVTF